MTAGPAYRLARMAEEAVLEAEAVEEPEAAEDQDVGQATRLPEPTRRTDVEAWRGEVRAAAMAAVLTSPRQASTSVRRAGSGSRVACPRSWSSASGSSTASASSTASSAMAASLSAGPAVIQPRFPLFAGCPRR